MKNSRVYTAEEAARFASFYHELCGARANIFALERLDLEKSDPQKYVYMMGGANTSLSHAYITYMKEVPANVRNKLGLNLEEILAMCNEKSRKVLNLVKKRNLTR